MAKIEFKILKDYGALSEYGDVYFRYIDWNGYEKYDLRRWSDDGEEPYKGITISEEELETFYQLLQEGTETITTFTPRMPLKTVKLGKATAKFLIEFGSFGENGNMSRQLNYIDWGHGAKFDIRPWNDDHSACGKGVTLAKSECEKLKEILETEFEYGEQEYGISFEDFVVRGNIFRCSKNHETETIEAMISLLTSDGEIVNKYVTAGYCRHCNLYFILDRDYQNMRTVGVPLCKTISDGYYMKNGNPFDGSVLNEESMLHSIGYTVNAKDDLSRAQRQNILSFAVETGLYTVNGICDFLDWRIDKAQRDKNHDYRRAISKWTEDREYINKYKIGTRPLKGVKSLKRKIVR